MSGFPGRHVLVIGGGASGVLLAYQLLQNPQLGMRVTLIERRSEIGRGPAYHTHNPDHVLNVRAANMSALPDDPTHFWRWLSTRDQGPICEDPFCFVPRRAYGDYLGSLIEPFATDAGGLARLTIVHGHCVDLDVSSTGVTVALGDGSRHRGDVAVLATGNDSPVARLPCDADPWAPALSDSDKNKTVLLLGTGLTMIDYVLSLIRAGHRGKILAISRRGLLAKGHRRTPAIQIDEGEVPFGATASTLLRWLRGRIDAHIMQGGDWRSVIDAIRPYTRRLWQELPLKSKRSFLEHARAWWDTHRHRMAPEVETRLAEALSTARLEIMAAKIVKIDANDAGALVRYRRRGQQGLASVQAGMIVDCTGIVKDPTSSGNPMVQRLFERGLARTDALKIGIDVTAEGAIVNRDGIPSQRLFAVGPLTRAAFWEIVAIPDIRGQCTEMAARLMSICDAAAESDRTMDVTENA